MSRRSQLFVGRLPLDSREKEVEEIFDRYGSMIRCDLKFGTGMAYAFVDYEDKRDAEDAIKYEHGRKFQGQTIVVEWARGPSSRPMVRKSNAECYRCHRTGHWARDCPENERDRYGSKRYSRSPKRNSGVNSRRSGSRSPGYYYRGRRRWRTPSQTRSPSYNRSRRPTAKKRTTSRSTSRSRSHSKGREKSSKRRVSKSVSRSRSKEKSRSPITHKGRSRSPRKPPSRSRSRSKDRSHVSPRKNRSRSPPTEGKEAFNGSRGGGNGRDQSISPKRRSRSRSSDRKSE